MRWRFLWLVALYAAPALAASEPGALVHKANNTALSATPSTSYSMVVRDGYAVAGDAPPLTFKSSNSACSLNAGAGDGGSQVPSADGKCWLGIADYFFGAREFGADRTGGTDSSTAFNAARAAAQSAGGYPVVAGAGIFTLTSPVASDSGTAFMFLSGVELPSASAAQIDALADPTIYSVPSQTGFTFAKRLLNGDGTTNGTNQNVLHVSAVVPQLSLQAAYEKNAVYGRIVTFNDSHSHGGSGEVGGRFDGNVGAGTQGAQVWALNTITFVPSGATATPTGYELDMSISQGDVPYLNVLGQSVTPGTSIGAKITSTGTNKPTVGLTFESTNGTTNAFHDLIAAVPTQCGDYYISMILNPGLGQGRSFAVDCSGNLNATTLQFLDGNGAKFGPVISSGTAASVSIAQSKPADKVAMVVNNTTAGAGTSEIDIDVNGVVTNNFLALQEDFTSSTATVSSGSGNTGGLKLTALAGNVIAGSGSAIATNATQGFLQHPTMAGAPTGIATIGSTVIDTTDNKFCWSNGGGVWKCAAGI